MAQRKIVHKTQPLCTYFLLNCTKIRQGSSSYLRQHLQKLWLADLKNQQSYGTTSVGHRLFKWKKWRIFFQFKSTHFFHRCRTLVSIVYYLKRIGLPNFLGKFGITFMSTGLPRLRMAIVKLNKVQRMPENMSQLCPTKLTCQKISNVIRK